MSIFQHHDGASDEAPGQSHEGLRADGLGRRHVREAFDVIVETSDPDEVDREAARGWVILEERQVTTGRRGPSGDDLITGIEGLRVGGMTRT